MRGVVVAAVVVAGGASGASQQDISALLPTIAARVDAFYARARSVVARETVTLQPLGPDLRPWGHPRVVEYDVRIEWTPPSATITRELLKRAGYVLGSSEDPECFDPKPEAYEPLAPLHAARHSQFLYTVAGSERASGRSMTIIEYRPRSVEPASVTTEGRCGTLDIGDGVVGRVWMDSITGDVSRVDQRLARPVTFVLPAERERGRTVARISQTLTRHDVSTRYEAIAFRDPDERVTLPVSIRATTVIENGGVPRLLTTHRFSNYRRFVTGGRVVK